jgi:hypothetical protein
MNDVTIGDVVNAVDSVIVNVRNLADSLQVACDIFAKLKLDSEVMEKQQPEQKTTKQSNQSDQLPTNADKPNDNNASTTEYKFEDVRCILAKKSQCGFTAEVKDLIAKYGASKLSEIDPKFYADIIKDAEVLGNE